MNTKILLIALGGTVAACAPMEQAPLVYASKNQFGVHVTAGAPDTPGFEVSIGFKSVDAAFVPVAVAKYCGNSPNPDCENAIYQLTQIIGGSSAAGSLLTDEGAVSAMQTRIETEERELAKLKRAIAADQSKKKTNAEQRTLIPGLQQELAAEQAKSPDPGSEALTARDKRVAELDAQMKQISSLETDAEIDLRINNNRASAEALATRLEQDRTALNRAIAARNASSSDRKEDAYSVFGSFNGGANGDKDGASLALGKIFSTGIAAQNLTQGMGKAARATAQAQCLRQVQLTAEKIDGDEAEQKEFIEDVSRLCRTDDLGLE